MANKTTHSKTTQILLSRAEALEVISLLTARLANRPLSNRTAGAVPEIVVTDRGSLVERIYLCLDPEEK
jgi:hypothetical protein